MSSKQPVGVIGAMDSELSSLIAALAGGRLSDQDLDELSDFVRKARERSEGK